MLDYKHPQQQRPYFISMPSTGRGLWEAFHFCGITDNCSKLLQHSVSWEQRLRVIKGQRGWLLSDPLPLALPSFGFGGRVGSREHSPGRLRDVPDLLCERVGPRESVVPNYPWCVFSAFPSSSSTVGWSSVWAHSRLYKAHSHAGNTPKLTHHHRTPGAVLRSHHLGSRWYQLPWGYLPSSSSLEVLVQTVPHALEIVTSLPTVVSPVSLRPESKVQSDPNSFLHQALQVVSPWEVQHFFFLRILRLSES